MYFNISQTDKTLIISGELTEKIDEAEFKQALVQAGSRLLNSERLTIDTGGLVHGNSSGLVKWIRATVNCVYPITYINVPIWLIYQFSDVPDFLNDQMNILSFYAPFYSAVEDKNIELLLTFGENITLKEKYDDDDFFITIDNQVYEADFDVLHFLQFIKAMSTKKEKV